MSHVIEMTCNAEYVHGRVQKTQVLAEDDGSLFHVLTTFQAFMRAMGFSNETIERHVKTEESTTPPLKAGDQVAYHDGNGWEYVTIAHGDIKGAEIRPVEKNEWKWTEVSYSGTVKKPEKETMQGNDLSVNVEDDLRFGEAMESLDGRHEPEKDEDGFTFWHSDRMPPWVDLNDWVEVKGSTQGINHPALLLAAKYVNWADVTAFKKQEYKPKFGPDKDGWIEHRGGAMPVSGDCIVSVKWRNGTQNDGYTADTWRWHWIEGSEDNLIAYKIESQFSAERGDDEEAQV